MYEAITIVDNFKNALGDTDNTMQQKKIVVKGFLFILGYIWDAKFESVVHSYPSHQGFKLYPF